MISLLFLGLLLGMRHALEADHLAAVAAISSKEQTIKATIRHGAVWGLGHTTTLFIFGSIVIWMDTIIPEDMANHLEYAVGIMLILLGLDVIRRLINNRIHYHTHQHQHENPHFHAHSHAGEADHKTSQHQHIHPEKFPVRTLFIGLMHGMAGSAALILLTLHTLNSNWLSMLYMLLFGIGSIIGMALISIVIAIPLKASSRLTWLHNGLQASIGSFTLIFGIIIVMKFY